MNALVLVTLGLSMAAVLPSPEITARDIRQFPQLNERVSVYTNGFDDPALPGMKLERCAQLAPGEGLHGTGGLRIQCNATDKGRSVLLELPEGIPDARYMVSVSTRGKDLVFHEGNKVEYAYIDTRQRDLKTNKTAMWKYSTIPCAPPPGAEFKEMEYSFVGQEGKKPFLTLFLKGGWSGTIWFDDVRVWRCGIATTTLFTYPRQNTFFADQGKFTIHADVPQGIQAAAVVSLEQGGKVLKEQVVRADERGNLCGDFGTGMPLGFATVRVLLADLKKRQTLGESTLPVTVRAKEAVPHNAAMLDEHDRLIVAGKPLMPLGLCVYPSDEDRETTYRHVSEAGFNCTLDTAVLKSVSKQEKDRLKAATGRLDVAHRYKLRQILDMAGLHRPGFLKDALGESDREKVTEKLINAFKDHPALMAWYITDEHPISDLPDAIKVKDHINALDPWHPVITLTNKPIDLPQYALSGNVFMPDAYPLFRENSRDVDEYLHVSMIFAKRAGIPIWAVPQAFGWGSFFAKTAEEYRKYYLPTEEDMRSMALHFAIDGAKGFVFFWYPPSWDLKKAAKLGDEHLFERVWPRVRGMAQSIKLLEPFVLSVKDSPVAAVENQGKATVRALAYTAENGKHCLIVVGCGGASAKAIITVPGVEQMKSRFGRTENLGGGKYQFSSPDLGSDMLFD